MPLSKFESFLTNTKLDIEVGSQKAKNKIRVFKFKTEELEWISDRCHDVSEAHCLHHDHLDLPHQQDLPEQDQEEVGCQQAEV